MRDPLQRPFQLEHDLVQQVEWLTLDFQPFYCVP